MGRPAVVCPPAGDGGWARPCRGAGGGKAGRFLRKHRGWCGPRGLDPYREVGGPRWAAKVGAPGRGTQPTGWPLRLGRLLEVGLEFFEAGS